MTSQVTVRFWAGARRAAGRAEEPLAVANLHELRGLLTARPELAAIVTVSSFLVDGARAADDQPLPSGAVVDVLPPFAGGSSSCCVGETGSTWTPPTLEACFPKPDATST